MESLAQRGWKSRLLNFYEQNETRLSIGFFLGGFLFDIFTLAEIDDPFSVGQQIVYLALVGAILYFDFLWENEREGSHFGPSPFVGKIWPYRKLLVHFLLGSLLSIYSLFFLMSASFFSSIAFVLALAAVMVLNEMDIVQGSGLSLKVALYLLCLFCFFSMLFPILLGFVGLLPFLLALLSTLACTGFFHWRLRKALGPEGLKRKLLLPGFAVAGVFLLFYLVGWIPPVPLSAKKMGVYHGIEKEGDAYVLLHEKPWWKFWQSGDQNFRAAPGDRIYFFASIFSPGRFDDSVVLHWMLKHPKRGWQSTDRIKMRVVGGRKGGYRGYTVKQNFSEGDWRVSVETTDGREIGRLYFEVEKLGEVEEEREFQRELY